ncbi:hypothetical protein [Francisella sp. W12-1067]
MNKKENFAFKLMQWELWSEHSLLINKELEEEFKKQKVFLHSAQCHIIYDYYCVEYMNAPISPTRKPKSNNFMSKTTPEDFMEKKLTEQYETAIRLFDIRNITTVEDSFTYPLEIPYDFETLYPKVRAAILHDVDNMISIHSKCLLAAKCLYEAIYIGTAATIELFRKDILSVSGPIEEIVGKNTNECEEFLIGMSQMIERLISLKEH